MGRKLARPLGGPRPADPGTNRERKKKPLAERSSSLLERGRGAPNPARPPKKRDGRRRAKRAAGRRPATAKQEARADRAAEIEKAGKKPDKKANRVSVPAPKVTGAELERRREEERMRLMRNAEEVKKREKRVADEEEYERIVLVSNTNRDDSLIEAHSVDEAIAKISIGEGALPPDRHPERRLKASFKAFEEAELAKLKEEKPGLTLNQYKDMIWKMWKKSPDNPLNQVAE
ncbi:uncharacterized protein A4U43_C07F23820 [Asparagus officinalis]|uniref:Coiled-coil domain-containing protein n=1 Tax=Asparagus officinalis TaxID=4686 RepID=A0A5P1EEQ6_ASPOF|nr:coiled-coil domain-containing protein 124 [Asparagus officinalis]ONK64263.1 uncharacterized protein A4U43_C07F23820 [Asparagus officinalis]